MSLFSELDRRNVTRVGDAYAAVSWLIIQVSQAVLPLYGFGDGAVRGVIAFLAIGLLPTLVLACMFDVTPTAGKAYTLSRRRMFTTVDTNLLPHGRNNGHN